MRPRAKRIVALPLLLLLGCVLTAAALPGRPVDPGDLDRVPGGSRGASGAAEPSQPPWAWPLTPNPEVVRRFLPPEHPWSPGHRGVDLAAATGQLVLAPTDGVVTFVGVVAGRGVLVVEHAGGLRSTFEPVDAVLPFGAVVRGGDPLATVATAAGHCAPTTCLHWGVLRESAYLDPLAFLGVQRVVLLPVTAR